jgi:hypothetical protein
MALLSEETWRTFMSVRFLPLSESDVLDLISFLRLCQGTELEEYCRLV